MTVLFVWVIPDSRSKSAPSWRWKLYYHLDKLQHFANALYSSRRQNVFYAHVQELVEDMSHQAHLSLNVLFILRGHFPSEMNSKTKHDTGLIKIYVV